MSCKQRAKRTVHTSHRQGIFSQLTPLPGILIGRISSPHSTGTWTILSHEVNKLCAHLQRFNPSHKLEGIMPGAMSTDVAFEGALQNPDSRSRIDQSNIGITMPSVERAVELEYQYMLTGNGSMLSRSKSLRLGGVEVLEARLLPDGRALKIRLKSGVEGLCVMPASSRTVLLTQTRIGGMDVIKLTNSRVDSPPCGVGDREPPSNDDRADVVLTRAEGVLMNDLGSVCVRIGLKSTEMLMHVLPVGESILQGESNCLCSHKAGGRVDNHIVEDMVSPVYILLMGSLEVCLDQPEELEYWHIEVMVISVRIFRQEPLLGKIRMKRVARGRTAGHELLSFVHIDISSIRHLLAPILPLVVCTLRGGHEVLQSS